jgi:hypothetical protein
MHTYVHMCLWRRWKTKDRGSKSGEDLAPAKKSRACNFLHLPFHSLPLLWERQLQTAMVCLIIWLTVRLVASRRYDECQNAMVGAHTLVGK